MCVRVYVVFVESSHRRGRRRLGLFNSSVRVLIIIIIVYTHYTHTHSVIIIIIIGTFILRARCAAAEFADFFSFREMLL